MIQFKIKGVEYTVKEPTIRDYYKIQHLFAKQGVDAKVEILSELSECPIKTLKLLDKYQFLTLWNELAEGPLNISDSTPFHKTFMMNENMYGFLDLDKVSLGEFVDMDILRNDPQSQQKLHTMMAVLYRPAIWITDKWLSVDKYDSDSLEKRAELFMDLPLKYVYGSLNFFLQVSRYLYETTLDSLINQPETTQAEKEMIYEEFKGTGNSEIHLDRRIAEKRVFPAININRSGTRKEELITDQGELAKMWILRKLLHPMDELAAIEFLLDKMKDTKTNSDFFEAMKR